MWEKTDIGIEMQCLAEEDTVHSRSDLANFLHNPHTARSNFFSLPHILLQDKTN